MDSDLNFVFKTFLERMALIKQQVGEEAFKEQRHIIIVFTDGNLSYLLATWTSAMKLPIGVFPSTRT